MGTQLILTVGTNPLPVWVAWYHLKEKLPQPIKVRLVHTAGTVAEKDRLEKYCQGADFLAPIQTSDGNPRNVRSDIRNIANDLSEETALLHIHYTGGTKVMAVETVAAIEADLPHKIYLDTSYLDPRAAGPAIMNRAGNPWVKDTRKGVDPDLSRIAELNGFELGPFTHQYWDQDSKSYQKDNCPAPKELNQEQLDRGSEALRGRHGRVDPTLLEYGAYNAFKTALDRISTRNATRKNYKLFHNVYVRRARTTDQKVRPFELDVVAVLGYQIVVVSCTRDSDLAQTKDSDSAQIKKKGMEAILRARQLGGDEARAIVLCRAHSNTAKLNEDELRDEMGSTSEPLQVWGRNTWQSLSTRFEQYLQSDLHWR